MLSQVFRHGFCSTLRSHSRSNDGSPKNHQLTVPSELRPKSQSDRARVAEISRVRAQPEMFGEKTNCALATENSCFFKSTMRSTPTMPVVGFQPPESRHTNLS